MNVCRAAVGMRGARSLCGQRGVYGAEEEGAALQWGGHGVYRGCGHGAPPWEKQLMEKKRRNSFP